MIPAQPVRGVGIVGAGFIFETHRQAWAALGIPVSAVADIDKERASRAAARHGIPLALTDWRDLLNQNDIDVIDVCSPPKFHAETVIESLESGRHVVCEKPLAPNLAEADRVLSAERRSPGKLTVVHQFRSHPLFLRFKWLAAHGYLGTVRAGTCSHYESAPMNLVRSGAWGNWELTGGGFLMTKAIHYVDLFLWLLGDAKRVQATMGTFELPIESEDQLAATIEFKSGALVTLTVGHASNGGETHLAVIGDRGSVRYPWALRLSDKASAGAAIGILKKQFPYPEIYTENGCALLRASLAWKIRRLLGARQEPEHVMFLSAFISAISAGRNGKPPMQAEDARRAVELCTAIYASAITGQPVELPLSASNRFYKGVRRSDYNPSSAGAGKS